MTNAYYSLHWDIQDVLSFKLPMFTLIWALVYMSTTAHLPPCLCAVLTCTKCTAYLRPNPLCWWQAETLSCNLWTRILLSQCNSHSHCDSSSSHNTPSSAASFGECKVVLGRQEQQQLAPSTFLRHVSTRAVLSTFLGCDLALEVTPHHKTIFVATLDCNFATVINCNVSNMQHCGGSRSTGWEPLLLGVPSTALPSHGHRQWPGFCVPAKPDKDVRNSQTTKNIPNFMYVSESQSCSDMAMLVLGTWHTTMNLCTFYRLQSAESLINDL